MIPAIALFVGCLCAQSKPAQKPSALCGPLTGQILRCPRFSFTYKVPFGWVDRTSDMNADAQSSTNSVSGPDDNAAPGKQPEQASSAGSETLLAVFERPPGAPGDTVDSAVVIVAEPLANYHGVKTAADYFGAIAELAERRGFSVVNDPHSLAIGAKHLVRCDFSKPRGKLTMHQTSMAMIEKGYIVSFTVVAGSEDEVNDLIANLSFSAQASSARTAKEKK